MTTTRKNTNARQMPFTLRIPSKLRADFEEYCQNKEITLTQGILDAMRATLNK